MAGPIPKSFIDDLLGRIDIVEVIDAHVPLKKTGRDFQALCPFHNEKTPSFTVSQHKQFYHCFGCGAHGSAIGFLMNHRNLGFVEAVEELAAQAGIEVPREGHVERRGPDHGPLYETLTRAQQYYVTQLKEHGDSPRAIDYLKRRGLTGQIAKTYGIGFAPPGWDNLGAALGGDESLLERAGLRIRRDDGRGYDRFRDRIMFPIRDRRGRLVAFGGRVIDSGEPKYLNSPETPIFQKRRELYGLYEARQHDDAPERLYVVEGYMDVVALAQHGIHNAVATLGTATTPEHLEQVFRAVPEIVFCFDGDRAGRRAAWRALETTLGLLHAGRQAGFLFLPEGEDPDSLVRTAGPSAFRDRNAITPLSDFLLEGLGRKTDLTSRDGRARLLDLARPLIEKIPTGSFRDLLIDELEKKSWASQTGLGTLRKNPPASAVRSPPPATRRAEPIPLLSATLSLLLKQPTLAAGVSDPSWLPALEDDDAIVLSEVLELLRERPHLNPAAIVEHWRGTDTHEHLAGLLLRASDVPEDGLAAEFNDAIKRLEARAARRRRPALDDKRPAELSEAEKKRLRERYSKPG